MFPVRATVLSSLSMFIYVVVLNIILNTNVTHLHRAIAVTVMEGVTNMLRCPLAVLLTFKTHQKNERNQKKLSRQFRQELEIQDAIRRRMEMRAQRNVSDV